MVRNRWVYPHTKKTMKRKSKKQLLEILKSELDFEIASVCRNWPKRNLIELILRLQ